MAASIVIAGLRQRRDLQQVMRRGHALEILVHVARGAGRIDEQGFDPATVAASVRR